MNETDDVTSMPKEGTSDLFAKRDKTSPGPSWKIVKHQIQDPDRNKKFFENAFHSIIFIITMLTE